ncbi:MAG TPA: ABC transporter ATP-binding protein/permease [Candidatus Dorea intestinavium]|nr:ABC transporter ATP-binding protein/permease [Candidatus Dorea intestinavium]
MYKKIMKLLKPHAFKMVLLILFSFITVASTLYVPILLGQGVDQLIGKGKVNFSGLDKIIIGFFVVIAITAISQWIISLITNRIIYQVIRDLRIRCFNHLQRLPISYIDNNRAGEVISRITTDIDQFSDGMLMAFTQFFTGVLTIIGTLLFMIYIHFGITLIVVVITPFSFVFAGLIAKKTFLLFKEQSVERGKMTSHVEEMVGNQYIVKAFGREKKEEADFNVINKDLEKVSVDAVFFSSIVNPSTRFINGLVFAGVCIYGAIVTIKGGISVGQLASFMSYANQYTKPFNEISGVVTELQNAFACASRVFDFLATTEEASDEGKKSISTPQGEVEFREVDFSYTKEKSFIENINLEAKVGERIALVGPTGCGKTTLINLIMRFYDIDQGEILVDGVSTKEITRQSLRHGIGMVLQETWLKKATIAENISYGKPEATKAEIIKAAKLAHAHDFIERMPDQYNTIIDEEGSNLSQGQKQLLCIARVFLMKPPILILDEATSSIDTRTELKIQEALDTLMKGRTSFVVAHRLSTVRDADLILVMKDGKIIEQGKHDQLLELEGGFYKQLYRSQFALDL